MEIFLYFIALFFSGCFPQGCAAFKTISTNIEKEESGIKDDSGMQDVQYTEVGRIKLKKGMKEVQYTEVCSMQELSKVSSI